MATAAVTNNPLKSLWDSVNCSICQDVFKDPVTLDCGHNFCRSCITQRWEGLKRNFPCPQCRKRFRKRNMRPNPQLEEIAKQVRAPAVTGSEGEKMCETHKKAKQVRTLAVKGSEGEKLCETHKKPLNLYCWDHSYFICETCDMSLDHRHDEVLTIEDAAKKLKDEFQKVIQDYTSKKEARETLKLNEEQKISALLTKTETERQKIVSHFEREHQILKEEEQHLLEKLEEMEKTIQKSKNECIAKLSKEIEDYDKCITNRKKWCQKTAVDILMDDVDDDESNIRWWIEFPKPKPVSPELETIFSKLYKTFQILKDAVIIERVDVTLDPVTAHPAIAISEDGRSARRFSIQAVPNSPKRFDAVVAVLGSEGFTSGRHCWEAEVGLGKDWAVGIATESVKRKELFTFDPFHGIWSVWMIQNKAHPSYWAPMATIPAPAVPMTTNQAPICAPAAAVPAQAASYAAIPALMATMPMARNQDPKPAAILTETLATTSQSKPSIKIRVCLDYDRGLVTFHRSDNMAPSFTYCATFTEKIFPFFWLWSEGAWVRLCP